jgi:hypothetical protein
MSGTILDRILARKREETAARSALRSLPELRAACAGASAPRGFGRALAERLGGAIDIDIAARLRTARTGRDR